MDLIQAFFQRDLSEAEHQALAELLEKSPEAALDYERRLGEYYLATGLPQPTLPEALRHLPNPGAAWLAGKGSLLALAAGLALTGALLLKFWPRSQPESSLPLAPTAASVHLPLPVKAPGMRQPIRAAEAPRQGQELSVVLDAPRKSLVTVRILGPQGQEVRDLYTGFVESGRWSFRWDGLVENGQPAAAGNYRIDVQSGELHLTKNVQIKLNPPTP
ncbi:MAG TPA: FlgD immunoglobulin-like domain containing protein [bacterium]|nr:FlgD immunoglobulin-like domain containing protein [bacterium]